MKTKDYKGITLIALIVTIVVILILAGVTISAVAGDNGILTQSINAADSTDMAQTEEAIELELVGRLDSSGKYTLQDVVDSIKEVTGNDANLYTGTTSSSKGTTTSITNLLKNSSNSLESSGISITSKDIDIQSGILYMTLYIKDKNNLINSIYFERDTTYGYFEIYSYNSEEIDANKYIQIPYNLVNACLYCVLTFNLKNGSAPQMYTSFMELGNELLNSGTLSDEKEEILIAILNYTMYSTHWCYENSGEYLEALNSKYVYSDDDLAFITKSYLSRYWIEKYFLY